MDNILVFAFFNLLLYTFTKAKDISCTKRDSLKDINITDCHIIIPDEKLRTKLKNTVRSEDVKLFKLVLEFPENTRNVILAKNEQSQNGSDKLDSYFYTPFHWYITTSRHGQKLIMLKPNYETLSLGTLDLKTQVVHIDMRDEPNSCLNKLSLREYFFLVKEFIQDYLKERKDENAAASLSHKVCTSVMKDADGYAEFSSICFEEKHNGTCLYLTTDQWSRSLQGFIIFVKLLAILFCPLIISKRLYQLKYLEHPFALTMQQNISLKVKVSKERRATKDSEWDISIPMSHFKKWKHFKPWLLKTESEYNIDVKDIYLGVEKNRLVSRNYVPTGFCSVIFNNLFYCKIRDSSGFAFCCASSICPRQLQGCRWSSSGMSWFHCCQGFMKVIAFILIPLPWIIRLLIYYFYEEKYFMSQQSAAKDRGVHLTFDGDLLGYISPIHWLFVVIYVIYFIDVLVFGTFVHRLTRELAIGIKQCVRNLHLGWTFEAFNWAVRLSLGPFTLFGIFGIFVAPIYWIFAIPLITLMLCLYYLPLVNLLFRFLLHLAWFCLPDFIINSKKTLCLENISKQMEQLKRQINLESLSPDHDIINRESRSKSCLNRHFQILMVLLCLFTLGATVVVLNECVGYVIEMISYTLIGIILHSGIVLPFFSLGCLIVIYFFRSMNKVRLTFLNFNKIIINEIIKSVGNCEPKISADTAHFVFNDRFDGLTFSKSNGIICSVFPLLLYFDANERPLIPSQFFYRACEMPILHLPGSLSKNFLKAFLNFFLILLFLIFVAIVVMTFGEIHNISSTNQMLATLAGGFLPWFIEHIIATQSTQKEINTESLNFKDNFQKIVNGFTQRSNIVDINGHVTRLDKQNEPGANVENVSIDILEGNEGPYSDDREKKFRNLFVHFSKTKSTRAEQQFSL